MGKKIQVDLKQMIRKINLEERLIKTMTNERLTKLTKEKEPTE